MNEKLTSVWSFSLWRNFWLTWMLMVEPEKMEHFIFKVRG